MPTPTTSFFDVAARFGNVDPSDVEAVQNWYTEVLPTLPPETIEEILETLLESDGDAGDGGAGDGEPARSYPQGVPLPSLSSSPPAPIPLLAGGWKKLLARLARRAEQA